MAFGKKAADLAIGLSPAWSLGAFPRGVFFGSVALSLLLGPLLAWIVAAIGIQDSYPPRSDFWDNVTAIVDPWFLQLVFAVLTSGFALSLPRHKGRGQRVLIALWPFILLVAAWAIATLLFKEAFSYPRPGSMLPEPWLTGFFRDLSRPIVPDTGIGPGTGLPSGFVTRQLVLAYFFALIVNQRQCTSGGPRNTVLHVINIVFLAAVTASRYYREDHSLFAIALTLPMATAVFWLMTTPLYRLTDNPADPARRPTSKDLWNTVVAYVVTILVLFPYALRPILAIALALGIITAFAVAYLAIEYIHSRPQEEQFHGPAGT